MTYSELENLSGRCNKMICLFGAGLIGKTYGYDLISSAGFNVDFYCDNNVAPGTVIRDGVEARELQYLYVNKDCVQVFLTVGYKYQTQIEDQLHEHDIYNIIIVNKMLISQVLDSIEASGNECVKQRYHAIYNDEEYLKSAFNMRMGYQLDIDHPRTFNEKLQWLKLYDRKPEYTRMVDKYEAKRFVEERIGSGYTIPTLGVWDSFDEIDFDKLPDKFVLKCTHDSGSVIIVKDKESFNKEEARRKLSAALQVNYFWLSREWPYKNVKRRIIADEYIEEMDGNLFDYKVHCFNGEPLYIQVIGNRDVKAHLASQLIYDFEWEKQEWCFGTYPQYMEKLKKPLCLEKLYQLSKILCDGLRYVRIDFYIVSKLILFGEMTFYPLGGFYTYNDEWKYETDSMLGEKTIL